MSQTRSYKIAGMVRHVSQILNLSPTRILARLGLPPDYLDTEAKGVDDRTFFAAWRAFEAEYNGPNMPLAVGSGSARGPVHPALLAFAASPDLRTGFSRLAIFKPLVAPVALQIEDHDTGFSVTTGAQDGAGPMPGALAAAEIIFFLDFARAFTAQHVIPLAAEIPQITYATDAYRDWVGTDLRGGPATKLTFSHADGRLPLITADTEFYNLLEREVLVPRLPHAEPQPVMTERVRKALIELLPSGTASAEAICARLGVSKRSLQRRLREEGVSYANILEETRTSLALSYLRNDQLSAEEISYLLAYRDPNSFYRAFQSWTGMTPAQARATV